MEKKTIRELIHRKEILVLPGIVEEAMRVVKKKGIILIHPDLVQAVYELAEKNKNSFNSMAQDFLKGKRTEIDQINGAIAKEGEKLGIGTPVNRTLTHIIKILETTQERVEQS